VKLITILAPIRRRGTAEHIVAALEMLSGEGDTPPARLTEGHIVDAMDRVYRERKNLSLSLLNLESVTSALGDFLTGAVLIVTVLLLNIVFSTGELAEVAITVSTAILGLSFIFSTSAQHTFDSFVFLFVRHPYDVGDRIFLQGYDPMDVVKMELLHTTFRQWNGFLLTIPNQMLQSISIFNYKRFDFRCWKREREKDAGCLRNEIEVRLLFVSPCHSRRAGPGT
jgi:small-conductance mechanosensitive channel